MAKKKDNGNVFASAAADAQSNMKKLVTDQVEAKKIRKVGSDEIKGFNLRLPESLRKKAQIHRIATGESMNALIIRLLEQELGDD